MALDDSIVEDEQDDLVNEIIVMLSRRPRPLLVAIADRAEKTGTESWLPKMILEYLDVWA